VKVHKNRKTAFNNFPTCRHDKRCRTLLLQLTNINRVEDRRKKTSLWSGANGRAMNQWSI